jgi:hypothetical protein
MSSFNESRLGAEELQLNTAAILRELEKSRSQERLPAAGNANTSRKRDYETLKFELQDLRKSASILAANLHVSEKKLEAVALENCALKSGRDHGSESQMKRDNTRLQSERNTVNHFNDALQNDLESVRLQYSENKSCSQRLPAAENANTNRQRDYETLKFELQDLRKSAFIVAVNLHESEKKLEAVTLENCALKSQMKRDTTRLRRQRDSVRDINRELQNNLENDNLQHRDEKTRMQTELDWLKNDLNTLQLEKKQDIEEKISMEYQIKSLKDEVHTIKQYANSQDGRIQIAEEAFDQEWKIEQFADAEDHDATAYPTTYDSRAKQPVIGITSPHTNGSAENRSESRGSDQEQAQSTKESDQIDKSGVNDGTHPCIPERTTKDHLDQPDAVDNNKISEDDNITSVGLQEQASAVVNCVTAIMHLPNSNLICSEANNQVNVNGEECADGKENYKYRRGRRGSAHLRWQAMVHSQRKLLREYNGHTKEQIDASNSIGYDWGTNHPLCNVSCENGKSSNSVPNIKENPSKNHEYSDQNQAQCTNYEIVESSMDDDTNPCTPEKSAKHATSTAGNNIEYQTWIAAGDQANEYTNNGSVDEQQTTKADINASTNAKHSASSKPTHLETCRPKKKLKI